MPYGPLPTEGFVLNEIAVRILYQDHIPTWVEQKLDRPSRAAVEQAPDIKRPNSYDTFPGHLALPGLSSDSVQITTNDPMSFSGANITQRVLKSKYRGAGTLNQGNALLGYHFGGAGVGKVDCFVHVAGFGVAHQERGKKGVSRPGRVLDLHPLCHRIEPAVVLGAVLAARDDYFF